MAAPIAAVSTPAATAPATRIEETTGAAGDSASSRLQEVRDFRDQARYWTGEAQRLRDQLRGDGTNVTDLDDVLRQMRQLDDDRVYKDPRELERLQTQVAEGLKRFEFGLRRKVEDATSDQPALMATDDVPRGFRELVDEYYRSLSRSTTVVK